MSAETQHEVPSALRVRIEELLRAHGGASPRASERQLTASLGALAALVARDPQDHGALDLLAIDALITSAFVAENDPARLQSLAQRARDELSALGSSPA